MLLKIIILSFFISSPSYANWKDAWIGKYPTDNGKSIFNQKTIKENLKEILPDVEIKRLKSYQVESEITKVDHYIVIRQCQAHNCPSAFAMVVIDLNGEQLWAGFYAEEENKIDTKWYSNGDESLPIEIKRKFDGLD